AEEDSIYYSHLRRGEVGPKTTQTLGLVAVRVTRQKTRLIVVDSEPAANEKSSDLTREKNVCRKRWSPREGWTYSERGPDKRLRELICLSAFLSWAHCIMRATKPNLP
ncbi:unnamed protein product, partial [Ectocarpus sp. 12 AP-2014]